MCLSESNIDLLDKLVDVVCEIDENKTSAHHVQYLANLAIALIEQAQKKESTEVGDLLATFTEIHAAYKNTAHLPYLIDEAHNEIAQLLTSHTCHVYLDDEAEDPPQP